MSRISEGLGASSASSVTCSTRAGPAIFLQLAVSVVTVEDSQVRRMGEPLMAQREWSSGSMVEPNDVAAAPGPSPRRREPGTRAPMGVTTIGRGVVLEGEVRQRGYRD